MKNTRHREGIYLSDCYCLNCECQREAILLGSDMARALPKKIASWVIVNKSTGNAIYETFSENDSRA